MKDVLFICTANIFRSRFSEEVYNSLALNANISSKAFSAGLMVGKYKTRKIYEPALRQLELLKIEPLRKNELSVHVNDIKLDKYKKIICMDQNEHFPMVEANSKLKAYDIEYWEIVDEPLVSSNISLPLCYDKIKNLISEYPFD